MEYYYETLEHQHVTFQGLNMNFPPHVHQEVEIVTVTDGCVQLTLNGRLYQLNAGDSAFIQPGCIHSYQSEQCKCLFTFFDDSIVPSFRQSIHHTVYADPIWRSASEEFLHAIRQLQHQHPKQGNQLLIKGYLYVALALMLPQLLAIRTTSADFDQFQQILRYVNEHYTEEIAISETARHFGVTYEHLSRLYKEKTGLTYSQHVRLLRIAKAKQLLQETDHTILEIAIKCGYNNDRTFYRAFRAETGDSPRAYRRKAVKL